MIDSLISLLRAYVKVHELAALTEEDKLLESYLQIMQIRNKLEIRYHSRIADEVSDFRIPRLLLQPIIENAVIHGFTLHPADARIELIAENAGDCVIITVADNGRGMQEERLSELQDKLQNPDAGESPSNKGVGLVNVARRLKLTYGETAEIRAYLRSEGGMAFVLILPNVAGPERGSVNVQSHSG
jgi:two-component system sensor histidine kinase YesM